MKYSKILILALTLATSGCDEQALYSVFPPDDYYDPVFEVELRPDVLTYSGEISHQYIGDYSISLSFEKPNAIGYGYDIKTLQLQCAFKNATQTTKLQCGNSLLEYWGDESGISIGIYGIPEVAKKHEVVLFTLEFPAGEELEEIIDAYGKVSLSINKWADH